MKENLVSLDADKPESPLTNDFFDRALHANTSFPLLGMECRCPVGSESGEWRNPTVESPSFLTCWSALQHKAYQASAVSNLSCKASIRLELGYNLCEKDRFVKTYRATG